MRRGKIGRNDPCWCGSGKNIISVARIESEKPVESWKVVAKSMRDKFSSKAA